MREGSLIVVRKPYVGEEVIQPVPSGALNTFARPNQASSTWLFCSLQIHEGVNTSALFLIRCS